MTVLILSGISGSGKTTFVKQFDLFRKIVSADHYFIGDDGDYKFDLSMLGTAHAVCLRNFVVEVQHGYRDVVVDNTNTSVAEIAPYAALALAYGYELKIVIFNVQYQDIEKIAARNTHEVPVKTIFSQWHRILKLKNELPPYWPIENVNVEI